MAEFEIYKDTGLGFRRRFKANNGKILAESAEGYNNPANCEHAIILIKRQVANARINSYFKPDQNMKILRSEKCAALDNGLFSVQKARARRELTRRGHTGRSSDKPISPTIQKERKVLEERQYAVGDRVEKLCVPCGEERGHVVVSLNKRGQISRVNCPRCGLKTAFKKGKTPTGARHSTKNSAPYDWTLTYRKGQTMTHPTFGFGEVTAVIEPQKIDVLFSDKVRRLIHARSRS